MDMLDISLILLSYICGRVTVMNSNLRLRDSTSPQCVNMGQDNTKILVCVTNIARKYSNPDDATERGETHWIIICKNTSGSKRRKM